jgi:Flp pilus assembly protein TadD
MSMWQRTLERAWGLALVLALLAACSTDSGRHAVREAGQLLGEGRIEEALAAYRAAGSEHPESPEIHFGEGLALYLLDRYDEAEEPLLRAVELEPNDGRYHLYLGYVLSRLERREEATEAFRQMTRMEPMDPEGWRALGYNEYNRKRYPQARAALEKYLAFAREAEDRFSVAQLLATLPGDSDQDD